MASLRRKTLVLSCLFTFVAGAALRAEPGQGGTTPGSAISKADQALRRFTVADSIKSTHFVQPMEHMSNAPPVSPDGKRFLVVTERGLLESNLREFSLLVFDFGHLVDRPKRLAVFHTSSNRPGIAMARWVDNDRISFIGENPGEEPEVYAADYRSGHLRKLTTAKEGVSAYDVTHDLKTIAYYAPWAGDVADNQFKEEHGFAVTDERLSDLVNGRWKRPESYFQMFIVNTASNQTRPVKAPPFSLAQTRLAIWLSPDGRYAVTEQNRNSAPARWAMYDDPFIKGRVEAESGQLHKYASVDVPQIMLVDTKAAELRPLLDSPLARALRATWMSDSRSVIVAGTFLPLNVSDPVEFARREKTVTAVEVAVPSLSYQRVADVSDHEWWNETRLGNSAGTFIVDLSRIEDSGSWVQAPSRLYRREGGQWIQDSSSIDAEPESQIRLSEANNRWPQLVQINPTSKAENVIFDPNPQFKTLRFGREEIIHWTGNLRQPLVAGLLYPPNYSPGKKYPLVIQSYVLKEDGFLLDGPSTTAYAAQALVNHDVLVLQLSQSPLYKKTLGTADFGPTELSQIDSAVDYLNQIGLIDPARVGLIGFSMKGYQVLYALAHSKYRFAAATSAEGNDWGYWSYVAGGNSMGWAVQCEKPFGGPPWNANWNSWMKESITFDYDKIRTPLRLESDSNDFGAVLYDWEKFVALTRLHKPVELIFLSHGAHPVEKPWDRMTSQQGNVDWLMFWLKGEEDPDPAKTEQYERWHRLKKLQESAETLRTTSVSPREAQTPSN